MSFLMHPMSHDIAKRFDLDAIRASLRAIIRTRKGEKLFKPDFGANMDGLLFELLSPFTKIIAQKKIKEEITKWEPRVIITDVRVETPNEGTGEILINIQYVLKEDTRVAETATIRMERIR